MTLLPPDVSTPSVATRNKGLDVLRGAAVTAVLLFHAFPTVFPGGFLGVDLFFVLSGYLITGVLVSSLTIDGSLLVRRFWSRRLRRLLPALVLLLPTVTVLSLVVPGGPQAGMRQQWLTALTFTSNWFQIGAEERYFAQADPPLLTHLWSLAVEEQFYLFWPLVFGAGWCLLGKCSVRLRQSTDARRRFLAWAAIAMAVASATAMGVQGFAGDPSGRAYLGTDTHAFGLLAGSALALWPGRRGWLRPWARKALVFAAVVVLAFFCLTMEGTAPFPYLGGLVVVVTATCVLVLACTVPGQQPRNPGAERIPRSGRYLVRGTSSAFGWLGQRSYGLYLWHWPLLVLIMPLVAPELRTIAAILILGLSAGVAHLSWELVEKPVLHCSAIPAPAQSIRQRLRPFQTGTALALFASLCIGSIWALAISPSHSPLQERLQQQQQHLTPTDVKRGTP
ncbi:acyltransferase family protein [Arthrobacter sp. MA-N2]|uniref:acyltransferase family protein n=1 Tax=Arthrobacter sp. MA-N2 TaxID=1101188 RepID=UPI0004B99D01|nr:acyltransferase [Arthrobacter sp. MA-N2]